MAQTLKEEVKQNILRAAEREFAEAGYERATMSGIARRAEISTGNIYRYFEDKDTLFYSVLPEEFPKRFLSLVKKRVESLILAPNLLALDPHARQDAEALLSFWVEHRLKVITLLDRAEGSRYSTFAQQFVDVMLKPTLASLEQQMGSSTLSPVARSLLEQLFKNTVRTIVSILEAHDQESDIRIAFAGFWSYQLAGLAGFRTWVCS
ncbi:MAG: TetR/AcrR family transcriptional regulator [Polyangiaceae bacterium]